MRPFWKFVSRMAQQRAMLAWTMLFALLSALGLGVGLLSLAPVLTQILHPDDGRGLQALAIDFNAGDAWVHIPAWVIDLLPVEQFDGVVFLIIGIAVLTIVGALCNFMHQYFSQTMTTNAVADVRREVFSKVILLK